MYRLLNILTPVGERRWGITFLVILVFSAIFYQVHFKPFTRDRVVDSYSYYFAAKALAENQNPYDLETLKQMAPEGLGKVYSYLYTPVLAVMWQPMLLMEPDIAHQFIVVLSVLLAVFNAGLIWRLIRPEHHAAGWLVLFLLFHAVFGPLVSSIRLGQANVLLGTLVLGALYFERDDKPVLAGFLLALAILVKITPLVFLIDYVLRRRWRSLLATICFGAVITVGTFIWIGIEPWFAFAKLIFRPIPFHPIITFWVFIKETGAWLGITSVMVSVITFVTLAAIFLRVVYRLSQMIGESNEPVGSWGMLILFALLVFPLTWHHHYYLALLPFGYFTISAFEQRRQWIGWVWIVLTICALLRYPQLLHPMKPIASLVAIFLI